MSRYAIIVGAGSGLSAALARACAADGLKLVELADGVSREEAVEKTGVPLH